MIARISSGAPGLDTILRGGLLRGGTYVVSGPPGAGKTILGNQFCFSAVRAGGKALYVTVVSETHGRMLLHLQSLGFFDGAAVGNEVLYLSAYEALKSEGLAGLTRLLFRLVREHKATALVLDGIMAIADLAGSRVEYREFLHGLAAHNAVAGCTTLLLTTRTEKGDDPEFAAVDGIFVLSAQLLGLKAVRAVETIKFRGSGHLAGKHTLDITDDGIAVYPRFEALYDGNPSLEPDLEDRYRFGVARLDEMIGGGLLRRSSTLLFGSPGSGKTLLSLHFLAEGAARGEPSLYFGFSETADRLVAKARMVSREIGPYVKSGALRIETCPSTETLPDRLATQLFQRIDETGAKRLVIDGLEPFTKEPIDPSRTLRFVTALTNELRSRDVTAVFTEQTNSMFGPELDAPLKGVEAIVDNIIFLRFFELRSQLYRLLSILKLRESPSDPALREFRVTSSGLDVAATFESAEAILTGLARPTNAKGGAAKGGGAKGRIKVPTKRQGPLAKVKAKLRGRR